MTTCVHILEDKISEIQLKISSTDESWKEAYHIPLSVINKQQNIINDSIQLNSFLQNAMELQKRIYL